MLQGLQKFTRALKRDYLPARHADGSGPFSRELTICLAITWGLCLPLFIAFPAVCAWTPILGIGASATVFFDRIREIRKEMKSKTSGEIAAADGSALTLSGPGLNVCIVENTQKLVSKMTEGCAAEGELPAHVNAKIAPYISDSAEAALFVDAALQSQPQERIPFLRRVFKGAQEETAVAAAVLTPFGLKRKNAADYDAAVQASVSHCQNGLPQAIKVKPIRLKRGFWGCLNP